MDYEKAYKEVFTKSKEYYELCKKCGAKDTKEFLENVFPELKENENEDERIRKGIIDFLWKEKIFLQEAHSSVENNPKYRFVMDAIAWLEKQGEQNSTLSDEDKMMLNELIIGFYAYKDLYPNFWKLRTDEIIEWLKKKKDEHTTDNG